MDKFVAVDELAEILGLSERRVQQLADQGVVVKAKRGTYSLAESVQGYIQYRDEASARDEDGKSLNEHKLRLTAAKADTEEMKAARMRGELIPSKDVQVAWKEIATMIRMRLRAMCPDVTRTMRAAPTDEEANSILVRSQDDALRDIADAEVVVTARDSDEPQVDEDPEEADQ